MFHTGNSPASLKGRWAEGCGSNTRLKRGFSSMEKMGKGALGASPQPRGGEGLAPNEWERAAEWSH